MVFAQDFYVSTNGSDIPGNGSLLSPWRTISYALQSISPTSPTLAIINISSGDFSEAITMKDYTALKGGWNLDFSIWDVVNNKTIIQPPQPSQTLLTCSGTNSLTGLILKNAFYGISIIKGNVNLSYCEISYHTSRGISIEGDANVEITSSTIRNNTTGIYSYLAENVYISQNHFLKNSDKGIHAYFSTPLIEKNLFEENKYSIYISRDLDGGATISKNKFIKNTGNAIYLYRSNSKIENNAFVLNETGVLCEYYSYPNIINNTFFKNRADGVSFSFSGSSSKVINNIFYLNEKYGVHEFDAFSEPSLIFNCFYSNKLANYFDDGTTPTITVQEIANIHNGSSIVMGNVVTDPILINGTQNDFHLTFRSPCIDAGYTTDTLIINEDIDEEHRPNDVPGVDNNSEMDEIDIGCDEFYWTLTEEIFRDHILGRFLIPDFWRSSSDLNGDGVINIADLILLILKKK